MRILRTMGYALARDIHACEADGIVYFLDAGRDRYCKAGPSASRALIATDAAAPPTASALADLVTAGLLIVEPGSDDDLALCRHPSPERDLHAHLAQRPPVRPGDVAKLAALSVATSCRLRFRGFARALDWARRQVPEPSARRLDGDALAAEVARYQCARSLLPASPRCLLDSLMLKAWAAARGIGTQIVIGIRPLPFAAHCWVEHDGCVLNGSQDGIANFTPICVL